MTIGPATQEHQVSAPALLLTHRALHCSRCWEALMDPHLDEVADACAEGAALIAATRAVLRTGPA